ncbi:uncharacterized protein LOC144923989 [Branchiostoma floridae x Branchiostoma belcheri]
MANLSANMDYSHNTLQEEYGGPTRNFHTGFHSLGTPYVPVDRTPLIAAETTSFQSSRVGPRGSIPHLPNRSVPGPGFVDFRPDSRISRGRETCFCPDCMHRCRSTVSESIYKRTNDLNARTPTFPDQMHPTHVSTVHGVSPHAGAFTTTHSYHRGMQSVGFRPPQQHFINSDRSSPAYTHMMGNANEEYVTVPEPMSARPGIRSTNPADNLGYLRPIDEEPLDLSASGSSAKVAFFNNSQKCRRSIGREPLAKRIRLGHSQPARIDTRRLVSSRDVPRRNLSTCTENPNFPGSHEEPACDRLEFHQHCAELPRNVVTQISGSEPQLFENSFLGFSPSSPQDVSGFPQNVAESSRYSSLGEPTQRIVAAEENRQAAYIRSSDGRGEGNARTMSLGMASPCLQPWASTGSPSVNLQYDHAIFRANTSKHTVLIPLGNVIVPVQGIRAFRIAERPLVVQCKDALAPQEEKNVDCVQLRQYLTMDNSVVRDQTHSQAETDVHHQLPPNMERPSSKGHQVCQCPSNRMTESCTKSKGNRSQIGTDEITRQPPLPRHQPEDATSLATSPDACITSSLPLLVSLLTGRTESSSTRPNVSSPVSLPPNVTAPFPSPEPPLAQNNSDGIKSIRSSETVGLNGVGLSGDHPEQANTKCGLDENVALSLSAAQLPIDCPNWPLQGKSPQAEQPESPGVCVNQKNEKDGCTWIDQAIEGVVLGALFDRPFSELFDFWMSCQPVFLVTEGSVHALK